MAGKAVRKVAVPGNAAAKNAQKPVRLRGDSTDSKSGKGSAERMSEAHRSKNAPRPAKSDGKQEDGKRKHTLWLVLLLVAVVIAIVLFLLRGCGKDWKGLVLDMPEYEDSVGIDEVGSEVSEGDSIVLSVIPDFTVTKDNPGFLLPYPENAYDVEFSFVDAESGEERYHTKRVRPDAVIEIPAYSFCDEGEHLYRVEVEVYDKDTYVELPTAVVLEMKITKE